MKISCEIIKDLLPLYFDDVCSDDSKSLVDEHLETCNECKSRLQLIEMSLPISNVERNLKEADPIINLSKRWNKGMRKSKLKGILITLAVIAAIILLLHTFMGIHVYIPY